MHDKQYYSRKLAEVIIHTYNRGVKSFTVNKIDKKYDDCNEIDVFEVITDVLFDFQSKDFISLKFEAVKSLVVKKVIINESKVQELSKQYKISTIDDIVSKIKIILNEYLESPFPTVKDFVSNQLLILNSGKKVKFTNGDDISLLSDVLIGLTAILSQSEDIALRQLSIKTYNDSKKLGNELNHIFSIVSNEYETLDDFLQSNHVFKNPVFAQIKGNGVIYFKNGEKLTITPEHGSIQFAKEFISFISKIECNKLLSIENSTSFDTFSSCYDGIILYLGGFSNNANVKLIKHTDCPFYHFGDIDANGFKIMKNIEKRTNRIVNSYKMDKDTVLLYKNYGKQISDYNKTELQKMLYSDIYTNNEKEVFKTLLELGITIEQEIITDY